jgi:parallel beta-helix repeat protein
MKNLFKSTQRVVSLFQFAFIYGVIFLTQPCVQAFDIGSDTTFTSNIWGPINITASNITVDFNNYSVRAPGQSSCVLVYGKENVIIKNGYLNNADIAVYCVQSDNITIENIHALAQHWGIYLDNSSNCTINECLCMATTYDGIAVYLGSNNEILDSDGEYCGRAGIWDASTSGTTIDGCTASSNVDYGISIVQSSYPLVKYNESSYTGDAGFMLYYTTNASVHNNNSEGNNIGYLDYDYGSTNLTQYSNSASNNTVNYVW